MLLFIYRATRKQPPKSILSRRAPISSKKWLERQHRDPYAKQAVSEDLRARSAYKLKDIQQKHKLIKKTDLVIDLGSAPGGWAVVASELLGYTRKPSSLSSSLSPRIFCVDLLSMKPVPGAVLLQGDFRSEHIQKELHHLISLSLSPSLCLSLSSPDTLPKDLESPERERERERERESRVDVILSDMQFNMTGHRHTDQSRGEREREEVLDFCEMFLRPGGSLLCKVMRGGGEREAVIRARTVFETVKLVKPPASRAQSAEIYLLASNYCL